MNLLQIARKARFEVDAIRAGNAASGLWTDEEVIDAVNTAVDSAYTMLRLADSDFVTKSMKSTDASVDLVSEVYAPSSLAQAVGVSDYTLPPDLVTILSIVPTTNGFENVRFRPAHQYQKYYLDQRTALVSDLGSSRQTESIFSYLLMGRRTMRIAPNPRDNFDVELTYRFRPPRLQSYGAGKIVLTQASATVTGTGGTAWLSTGLRGPAELILGDSTTVVLNTPYSTISSIDGEGTLTLARTWPGVSNTSAAYTIAMVPWLPEEHHPWLAQMAAALMLRKVNIELSNTSRGALEKEFSQAVQPEFTMRVGQESLAVEPYEIP